MSIKEYALEAAKRGHRVFPLAPNSKIPNKGFKNFSDRATSNPKNIEEYWDKFPNHNYAILCDKLFVIDVDVKKDANGKNGYDTLRAWEAAGHTLPDTEIQTTPSGGRHYIFTTETPLKNSTKKLGIGIDTRGQGGYIVGAGSLISGIEYTLDNTGRVPLPDWLLEQSTEARPKAPRSDRKVIWTDPVRTRARAIAYLKANGVSVEGERDNEGARIRSQLWTYGCGEDEIFELLCTEWPCDPPLPESQLHKLAYTADEYTEGARGSESPEAWFEAAPPDSLATPIEKINQDYAFVVTGNTHHILHETTDEHGKFLLDHLNVDTFHMKLNSTTINHGEESIPVTREWIKSPNRRSYDRLVFHPAPMKTTRFYNLWRGYSVEPIDDKDVTPTIKAGYELFKEHIYENICDGNLDLYAWTMGWFADIIQNPLRKPETALVFRGGKGTGKTIVFEIMKRIMRDNYFITADRRYLTSSFNAHLEKVMLFVLDEATWAGDTDANPLLKKLISGTDVQIERKGIDPYTVNSYCRLAILSNENWVVPASEDERRYAVMDVNGNRKQDRVFFGEMMDSMKAGGDRYLLSQLQKHKITTDVFHAPATTGLLWQKERSLDPNRAFWLDCLSRGQNLDNGMEQWAPDMPITLLSDLIKRYYNSKNIRSRVPSDTELLHMFQTIDKNIKVEGNRVFFPTLENSRESWDKHFGQKRKW